MMLSFSGGATGCIWGVPHRQLNIGCYAQLEIKQKRYRKNKGTQIGCNHLSQNLNESTAELEGCNPVNRTLLRKQFITETCTQISNVSKCRFLITKNATKS